jgi:hypothetical protein
LKLRLLSLRRLSLPWLKLRLSFLLPPHLLKFRLLSRLLLKLSQPLLLLLPLLRLKFQRQQLR